MLVAGLGTRLAPAADRGHATTTGTRERDAAARTAHLRSSASPFADRASSGCRRGSTTSSATRGIAFRPPVYLSDQWGCPDGTPLIGVPFYLADARLERIEAEHVGGVESDDEAMRYLRHEAGHAINYAFRLYERAGIRARCSATYARPYRERYRADPLSRAHVRHILGWYAQKHPDEDFAETFAVWLTPGLDWRTEYAGWPALAKLE